MSNSKKNSKKRRASRKRRSSGIKTSEESIEITITERMQKEAHDRSVLIIDKRIFLFVAKIIIYHQNHFIEKFKLTNEDICTLQATGDIFNKQLEDDSIIALFKGLDKAAEVQKIANETGACAAGFDETLFYVFTLLASASKEYDLLQYQY